LKDDTVLIMRKLHFSVLCVKIDSMQVPFLKVADTKLMLGCVCLRHPQHDHCEH